jgi:hypothetical protein
MCLNVAGFVKFRASGVLEREWHDPCFSKSQLKWREPVARRIVRKNERPEPPVLIL